MKKPTGEKALPVHLQKLIDLLPLNERVHQDTIFRAYGKSNYARRIRKIQSEYGWQIDRVRGKKGANDDYYIRRSQGPVRTQQIRREVPPKQRDVVYERDLWRCQICQVSVAAEQTTTRAQCDHKIPAERGGASKDENLQTLCVTCNLKKRQACKSCPLESCERCEFAYPERLAGVVVLRLNPTDVTALDRAASAWGLSRSDALLRLIREDGRRR